METTLAERSFLTVRELADVLRVSRRTAYVYVQTGQVPSVRVGNSIRIPRAALIEQLGGSTKRPSQEP